MKKIMILIVLFSFNFVYAVDDLTVVAVGNAEKEKQSFVVSQIVKESKLNGIQEKKIKELLKLFINDFGFYRDRYKVDKKLKANSFKATYSNWKRKGYHYVLGSRAYKKQGELWINLRLYDVIKREVVAEEDSKLDYGNLRVFGHTFANKVFKKLNGEDSIFLKKIVFLSDQTSRRKQNRKEIYIMDFDGKRVRRLTYRNSMVISPALNSDNSKILYSTIESKWKKSSRGGINKVQNLNLYLFNMKNRKSRLISSLDGINSGAVFSDDPNKIYLTLSKTKNADIYEMNLKTRALRRLTTNRSDDVDPHLNKKGDLMTFLSGRPGKAMIYTMDPKGTEKDVKRLSFVGRFNASPRFSPNGKEIVFSSWLDNRFDLFRIDSDGTNLVRLTKNFGSNEEPSFSPDGQFIVFTSQRVLSKKKAIQDIYIMNREGEVISKITNSLAKYFTPRWTN